MFLSIIQLYDLKWAALLSGKMIHYMDSFTTTSLAEENLVLSPANMEAKSVTELKHFQKRKSTGSAI